MVTDLIRTTRPPAVAPWTADELMTINAARALSDGAVCFVGIGVPSTAAVLAQHLHAPEVVLVYESGTIGSRPERPPLSIGDPELAETADLVVSVPEIFSYWLQAGRIDVGFLGAAQIDRWANLNTTVVGDYDSPRVRLPGAGGAPEIAASARTVVVVMRHSRRGFVSALDFVTSFGHRHGSQTRESLGLTGGGPSLVVTDLGLLAPDPDDGELVLTHVHPGVDVTRVLQSTGWPLRVGARCTETLPPTQTELDTLRLLLSAPSASDGPPPDKESRR